MSSPSKVDATKKSPLIALTLISLEDNGMPYPTKRWLIALKDQLTVPPTSPSSHKLKKKLLPNIIKPMSKTLKMLMELSSKELNKNSKLLKNNTKLERPLCKLILEELLTKLPKNSDVTLNASTNAENKMTETASRNAIADKEPSLFKRPTSILTASSRENTVMSKTSAKARLETLTRLLPDSND
jgi:hypothetical protein